MKFSQKKYIKNFIYIAVTIVNNPNLYLFIYLFQLVFNKSVLWIYLFRNKYTKQDQEGRKRFNLILTEIVYKNSMDQITEKEIKKLTEECLQKIKSDDLYRIRNDAKLRAINNTKTYDEFR